MTRQESNGLARRFASTERSRGMIRPDEHAYEASLAGKHGNADTWIDDV